METSQAASQLGKESRKKHPYTREYMKELSKKAVAARRAKKNKQK